MIGTLLRRHLYHQRILLVMLIAGMVGFEVMIVQLGALMDRGPGGFTEILEKLPKMFRTFIEKQVGEMSIPAFPAIGFEHPATMGGGLAYVIFVGTTPAGERDSGLLDVLLARPLHRAQYLAASVLHLLLTALAIPASLLGGTALALALVDTPDALTWTKYLPAACGLGALMMAWGGIALLAGLHAKRRGTAVIQLTIALVVTVLLDFLHQFSSKLSWIDWISPFVYFEPVPVTMQGTPWVGDTLILCGLAVLTLGLAFADFRRRDL